MFNILTFTKTITNAAKLDRELKANASFGSLYKHMNISGNQVEIHFTANLAQAQIDELSAFVSAFSNISVSDSLQTYLKANIDPFIENMLVTIRAQNMEMGITQSGKSADVLGFFEMPVMLPNKTRAVSFKGSMDTGSLNVTIEIANYFIANPNLYSDLSPFITIERITEWRNKIYAYLTGG